MNEWCLFILLFVSQNSNQGVQKERNSKQHTSCGLKNAEQYRSVLNFLLDAMCLY